MYLLDTNICIYIIKQKPINVLQHFHTIDIGLVGISSVTYSELVFGAQKSDYPGKNLKALEKFISPLEILQYGAEAAKIYGKIRKELEAKGTPVGAMDALIAAHALSLNSILVTNNIREFKRVKKLKVENWPAKR